jgi:hypothetical protein
MEWCFATFRTTCAWQQNIHYCLFVYVIHWQGRALTLTFITRPFNHTAAADSRSHFHYKCPFLCLSGTAFSLSSINRCIKRDVAGPFGQWCINRQTKFRCTNFLLRNVSSGTIDGTFRLMRLNEKCAFSRDGQAWNWSVSRRVYVTQQQDMSMVNKIIHCIVKNVFIKLTVLRFWQTSFI